VYYIKIKNNKKAANFFLKITGGLKAQNE